MGRHRVPKFQAPQKTVVVEDDATRGSTVGIDLRWRDGALVSEGALRAAIELGGTPPDGDFPITYWRLIQEIPPNVTALADTETTGLYVITGAGTSATRALSSTTLALGNANGVSGNPSIDLAELPNSGEGQSPVKLYTRDAYGRIEGDVDADTDDLPEGATNLYFTDERAQDALAAALTDSADIEWAYDDPNDEITATLSAAIHASLGEADTSVQSVTGSGVDNTDPRNPVITGGGGATDFTDLGDVPSSYTGAGGQFVKVSMVETGLEFVAGAGVTAEWGDITGTLSDQTDLQGALDDKADTASLAAVATSGAYSDLTGTPSLGTMAAENAADYTPTSGLSAVALSNDYGDLDNLPTLGSAAAADTSDFATAAQGALAATAVQPGDLADVATTGDYADLINTPAIPAQFNPIAGTNISLSGTYPNITFNAAGGGGGTVTSVNLANSTGLTASGGPVTGSGTLTYTLSANLQAWHGIAPAAKFDTSAANARGLQNIPEQLLDMDVYPFGGLAAFRMGAGAANKPVAGAGQSIQYGFDGNSITQLYSTAGTTTFSLWGRSFSATTPGAWQQIWHSGNQLAIGTTATSARSALGLGTAATQNTGTSGANVPLLNGANTWSGANSFNGNPTVFVNPGSLSDGSQIQVSSPGSLPGIIGQVGASLLRRDIQFSPAGILIAVSAGSGGVAPQFSFTSTGVFTATQVSDQFGNVRLSPVTVRNANATIPDTTSGHVSVKTSAATPTLTFPAGLPVGYNHRVVNDHASAGMTIAAGGAAQFVEGTTMGSSLNLTAGEVVELVVTAANRYRIWRP